MTQIFISYAREDKEFVDELKVQLEQHGYTTWIDSESIRAGRDWRAEIDSGINSSDLVIVIMTPEAKKSEYVTYEWAYARGAKKEIITIMVERTTLHPRLEALEHIDFCKVQRWEKLFQELQRAESEKGKTNYEKELIIPQPTPDLEIKTFLDNLKSSNASVRLGAARLLGIKANPSAIPNLLEVAFNDSDYNVREAAIESLGKIGNASVVPSLSIILRSNDLWTIRATAAAALGKIGSPESVPVLLDAVRDKEWSSFSGEEDQHNVLIRIAAIKALGDIGDTTAIPELVEQLSDVGNAWDPIQNVYTQRICDYAMNALYEIGTTDAFEAIRIWEQSQSSTDE